MSSTRRDSRQVWLGVIALGVVATLVAQPAIAAAVQKIKGNVNIKDTDGNAIESEVVGPLGLLSAEGAPGGALKVQNFAGGGGLLATGECAGDNPNRPASTTVAAEADRIITGIIITGAGTKVTVSAPNLDPLLGAGPIVEFEATASDPNVFIGLGNGLTVSPAPLVFACSAGTGNFVILGQ